MSSERVTAPGVGHVGPLLSARCTGCGKTSEKGSNNYEKQRVEVAKIKRRIRRKVLDYQHKITTWLVREYDAVFGEDLNVKGMLEQSHNTRNKQDAA